MSSRDKSLVLSALAAFAILLVFAVSYEAGYETGKDRALRDNALMGLSSEPL